MIGIVIVAHGGLAREYRATLEHVLGPLPGLRTVSIEPGHDRAAKEAEICAAADSVDTGDGVVVVADLFGGTPSNLSLAACAPARRVIVYGANLPMLIKLAKSRHLPVAEAAARAKQAGRKYIDAVEIDCRGGVLR